jgi:hypothetical protein
VVGRSTIYGRGAVEGLELVSSASAAYEEPGSGCGGCGNGTSRIVPIGLEVVMLCFALTMFPSASCRSDAVLVLIEA